MSKMTNENGFRYWTNEERQWHREDGPAKIWGDGYEEWWFNGKYIYKIEIETWMDQMNIKSDWSEWTDKEKMVEIPVLSIIPIHVRKNID